MWQRHGQRAGLGVEGLRTGEGRCLCLARVRRRVRQYIHILNEEDKPRRDLETRSTSLEEARAARRTQTPSTGPNTPRRLGAAARTQLSAPSTRRSRRCGCCPNRAIVERRLCVGIRGSAGAAASKSPLEPPRWELATLMSARQSDQCRQLPEWLRAGSIWRATAALLWPHPATVGVLSPRQWS